jgi:hypothetical protein
VTTAATNEAVDNGACATCVVVTYPLPGPDYTRVRVSISGASAGTVGGASGRATIPVSASAIAAANDSVNTTPSFGDQTITNTITTTSTSITHGVNAILFAADHSCSGGIKFTGSSNPVITGETFSNGGVSFDSNSSPRSNGAVYYNSACAKPSNVSNTHAAAPVSGWPEDFSTTPLSTICSGTTIQSRNITYSTDTTFNGPVCTTGTITLSGNSHLTGHVTFVASQIILTNSSNANFTPYYQDLLFYQTGSGQMQITGSSGYEGATIFVPNGTLLISGTSHFGQNSPPGYIEAQDITITSTSNTEIKGKGAGAAATTSTTTGLTTSLSVTQTPTTIINTTPTTITNTVTQTSSLGSSLVQ